MVHSATYQDSICTADRPQYTGPSLSLSAPISGLPSSEYWNRKSPASQPSDFRYSGSEVTEVNGSVCFWQTESCSSIWWTRPLNYVNLRIFTGPTLERVSLKWFFLHSKTAMLQN